VVKLETLNTNSLFAKLSSIHFGATQSTNVPSSSKSTCGFGSVNVILFKVICDETFKNVKFVLFRNALFCDMFNLE